MLTTTQAARAINYSRNHIINCIRDGRIKAELHTINTRSIYLIDEASFSSYAETASNNRRIGRELFIRKPNRKPLYNNGYTYMYQPAHPNASCDGYVAEHVLVMEEHLKRYLRSDELVYHINRNRSDNSIANLTLITKRKTTIRERKQSRLNSLCLPLLRNPELQAKAISFLEELNKI